MRLPPRRAQFTEGVDQKEVMQALSQLNGNKGLVSALQQKLDGLVGSSSGFVESLHYKVRARVEALGGLQETHDELFEAFLKEKRELDQRYRALYQPLYIKRAAIVKGEEDVEAIAEAGDLEEEAAAGDEAPSGIPDFWLMAMRNNETLEVGVTHAP
jgi:nucleosome assembly protein 1-like 1